MQIHGFAKTTLLDYPKHVAATIFTGGCNFRCPFCHNGNLVLHPGSVPLIPEDEVLHYLKKRQGILEGVCITGGEPTLQKDLVNFISQVRELGYLVKLDTNGYCPDVLQELMEENLLDYVAMDIKNSPSKYEMTCALPDLDLSRIHRSIKLLINGTLPFEFRTTVIKQLHALEDFKDIGKWIQGASFYYLQNYTDSQQVISPGFTSYSPPELREFQKILSGYIPAVRLRGID